jgi:DNA-binding winged helix-turn-helix (wHTH) protein
MPPDSDVFRFGPFELRSGNWRVYRGSERVSLSLVQVKMLHLLVSRAGEIFSLDALIAAAFEDENVSESNALQNVSRLRRTIGPQADGSPFIETINRRGYRFVAPVTRGAPAAPIDLDEHLSPFIDHVDGNSALETLDLDELVFARDMFQDAVADAPDYAPARVGLANALVLMYESTRIDVRPDHAALTDSLRHAERACELDPRVAGAWSTFGFIQHCLGGIIYGRAAIDRAIVMAPDDWLHTLRLGYATWGTDRLNAARRLQQMYPGLSYPNWFATTVYIGRQLFTPAREELRRGCAAQDAQLAHTDRFPSVGMHLLDALALGECGDAVGALAAVHRELTSEHGRHVYARECAANCRYTEGALHLHRGAPAVAARSFEQSLAHVPGHGLAIVGLAAARGESLSQLCIPVAESVDATMVAGAALAIQGDHHAAARLMHDVLAKEPVLSAGWILPVEPLIRPTAHRDAWSGVLALVQHRSA